MFSQDEIVVYPAQGVGKIDGINKCDIDGQQYEFYVVRILSNNITLMVPVNNAANVGLRSLVTVEEAEKILASLTVCSNFNGHTGQNWNRRYREYSDKIKSTDLVEVTTVLHELLLISKIKDLSFGERRLMEQAMALVTGELSEVLALPEQQLKQQIQDIFQQIEKVEPVIE